MTNPDKEKILNELIGQARNLADLVQVSEDSIVSKILIDKPAGSLTLFAFDQGQRLSEHASPYDAVVQIVEGSAVLQIGGQTVETKAGQMVIMPAHIPHSVEAKECFKMLLTMIRQKK